MLDTRSWFSHVPIKFNPEHLDRKCEGAKILDDDDWEPLDEQSEGGILIDFKPKSWPISIAIDFLHSSDEQDVGVAVLNFGTFNVNLEGNTTEFNLGVRKIWDNLSKVRPFIGGGIAFINAEVKGTALGVSVSDDNTGLGVWFDGGVYFTLGKHFNIGADVRWSKAEVNLFNIDGEAMIRDLLVKILEREGYETVTASGGKDGIKIHRENPADLIITDLIMPEKGMPQG